jgi:hypothetical protein
MLDATVRPSAGCPRLRPPFHPTFHLVEPRVGARRRLRAGFAAVALLVVAGVGLGSPGAAHAGSLDALDPFDPVGSDPWLGPLMPTALYTAAEPPTRGRGPWLGVGGGVRGSPGERRRVFALVELGIPFDAVAGAHSAAESGDADEFEGSASDTAPAMSPEARPFDAEPRRFGSPPPAVGAELSSLAAGPSSFRAGPAGIADDGSASEAQAASAALPPRVAGCPDARSCDPEALLPLARAAVAEALRVQGGQAELSRLDGMAARSRAAASLPEVRLGAGTSRDESLRLAPTVADPARFTRDGGRDLWLEARLTWRLDGAIFARDEIAIMRLRAQQREELGRLASEVLEALVAFERARLRLSSELSTPDERDQAWVVQFGALARLDVLTEGWFSRQLERSRSGRHSSAQPRFSAQP